TTLIHVLLTYAPNLALLLITTIMNMTMIGRISPFAFCAKIMVEVGLYASPEKMTPIKMIINHLAPTLYEMNSGFHPSTPETANTAASGADITDVAPAPNIPIANTPFAHEPSNGCSWMAI